MSEPEGQRLCRGQGQRQNGVGGAVRISMCITTYMLVLPKAPLPGSGREKDTMLWGICCYGNPGLEWW